MYGELRRVQQRLGKETFPLIDQVMYPSYKEMSVSPGNFSLDCFRHAHLVGKRRSLCREDGVSTCGEGQDQDHQLGAMGRLRLARGFTALFLHRREIYQLVRDLGLFGCFALTITFL